MTDGLRLDPDAVRHGGADDGPVLVLLHGYGADEHDLFGLVPHLPTEYAVASVRAPLSPPWPSPGYSWYPIEGLTQERPAHVTRAAAAVVALVEDIAGDRPVSLLGFSQGGAVAIQAMRLAPARFRAVVLLAGYAAGGELDGDAELTAHPVPVFWGRGSADTVIPAPLIDQTAQWLPRHSTLTGAVYPGLGHGISAEELAAVSAFLGGESVAATVPRDS